MIFAGFASVPTDAGDPRLNAYFLEHLYKCLIRTPGHRSLWNPGCGYPAKNVFAYSDTLLSFEPLYAPWRAIGLEPFSAFQAWLMSAAALNFLCLYAFLRGFFRYDIGASSLGAFVFATGFPRLAQMGHAQLLPQFYIVALLWALCALARSVWRQDTRRGQRSGLIVLACAALTAQFYGGFYLAYFAGLLVLFGLGWAVLVTSYRQALLRLLREQGIVLSLSLLVTAAALWPLVSRYLWVGRQLHDLGRSSQAAVAAAAETGVLFLSPRVELLLWLDG